MIINKAHQHLVDHNVKPSMQRIAIMDYLLNYRTHPTADEVYLSLVKKMPTLSKTTVYNTLKLLTHAGAIQQLTIDDKTCKYDGCAIPHAHFRCKGCNCIYDIDVPMPPFIEIESGEKLMIDETQLYYYGYCRKCYEKMKQN